MAEEPTRALIQWLPGKGCGFPYAKVAVARNLSVLRMIESITSLPTCLPRRA